ncbi:fatty acid desaturase family protein [Brytella acorum]|uniref:Fatty acid desaturase n=1 Tax=Brytella acorum TaxID=2959299 RepID=A0AA35XVX8_9PROT|nr:fatty acid desaturase [Brytella acorum]CAI9120215.1 fatty acid desaturase [Brytella acorum]
MQHDCGHGSLFKKQWLNDLTGRICSLLTLTPYDHWRRHHALHHGSWNNMGTRGRISDMYSDCITTSEYKKMKSLRKIFYRISINPILTILIMPPFIFFIVYRIAFDTPRSWIRERMGVYLTNLCLFLTYSALIWFMGWKTVALVSFLVIYPAAVSGVWLFIVQHKFEGVHRAEHAQWNNLEASGTGCSFLRLPRVLRWFSGDIGAHHVHHAAPGIPNYRLVDCHNAHPVFQKVKILNFRDGMREAQSNVIWDEESRTMIELRQVC